MIPIHFQMVLQYIRQDLALRGSVFQKPFLAHCVSQTSVAKYQAQSARIVSVDWPYLWFLQLIPWETSHCLAVLTHNSQSLPYGIAIHSSHTTPEKLLFVKTKLAAFEPLKPSL